MKDRSIVLLNKNKSIKTINKESKITEYDPEYILIPMIEYNTNTFIMIKPRKKLIKATNFQISVTLQLKNTTFDTYEEEDTHELFTLKKSFTSIVEFVNFIHSIDRIDYVNSIINNDRFSEYEIMDIKSIHVTLYRNEEVIYEYNFESVTTDQSNCFVVTLALDEIYVLGNKTIGYNGFLNIRNNKWSIDKTPDSNSIIGINLIISQSIYFMEYETLLLFEKKTLSYNLYVFNVGDIMAMNFNREYNTLSVKESIHDDCVEVYTSVSYIQKDTNLVIEFLIYIKLLYTIIIMKFNTILYPEYTNCTSNSTNAGFDMFLEITLYHNDNNGVKNKIKFEVLKDKIIPFNTIVEKIYNKFGGIE